MISQPDCLFCRIVAGEVPATVVRETADTLAFRDINPQAPTHVLVVPREHYPNAGALAAADPELTPPTASTSAATGSCSTPARARVRPCSTRMHTCSADGA